MNGGNSRSRGKPPKGESGDETVRSAVPTNSGDEEHPPPHPLDPATLSQLRRNPFLELAQADPSDPETRRRLLSAEGNLLLLRQLAAKLPGRRVALFAMPKSGSTFLHEAIGRAASLPFLTLTNIAGDAGRTASNLGMNAREQEIDELALTIQTIRGNGSWIAQHHTRFTPYLGRQLRFFGVKPLVLVRNILDAVVSMDDMLLSMRGPRPSQAQLPYILPANFYQLDRDDRLTVLSEDFGKWLIRFLVSWKRGSGTGDTDAMILSYERDILHPETLAACLSNYLGFGLGEYARLSEILAERPASDRRFNQGVAGRGAQVPAAAQRMLTSYAVRFRDELGADGMASLFGDQGVV